MPHSAPSYPLSKEALWILSALTQAGHEAFLVGGCVRDLLRGLPPHDWDICTSALPAQTQAVFASQRLLKTGLKHGTVAVLLDGASYEVTTYRVDGAYSDGRRPDGVRFVSRLEADLARRDFTMNAIAMDAQGRLRDPFGGQDDLRRGLIRCVGKPEERFSEDGLRIMRALRFAASLGFHLEEETGKALLRSGAMLRRIAPERIQIELIKLLVGPQAPQVLRRWGGVLPEFWPQLAPLLTLEQNNPWHCYGGWEHTLHALDAAPPHPVIRLAVLLHDVGKPACRSTDEAGIDHFYGHSGVGAQLADEMLRALRLDTATRQRVTALIRCHDLPLPAQEKAVRRALGRLGEEAFFQLLAVKRADNLGQSYPLVKDRLAQLDAVKALALQILARRDCLTLKDLAVSGRDVISAGVSPGPQVGKLLRDLLEEVTAGTLPNDRTALLGRIAQLKQ